jgi:hypothetical protein
VQHWAPISVKNKDSVYSAQDALRLQKIITPAPTAAGANGDEGQRAEPAEELSADKLYEEGPWMLDGLDDLAVANMPRQAHGGLLYLGWLFKRFHPFGKRRVEQQAKLRRTRGARREAGGGSGGGGGGSGGRGGGGGCLSWLPVFDDLIVPVLEEVMADLEEDNKPVFWMCDSPAPWRDTASGEAAAAIAESVAGSVPADNEQELRGNAITDMVLMFVPGMAANRAGRFFEIQKVQSRASVRVFELAVYEHNLQRLLVYTSDSRMSLHSIRRSSELTHWNTHVKYWSQGKRYEGGNAFGNIIDKGGREVMGEASQTISRSRSAVRQRDERTAASDYSANASDAKAFGGFTGGPDVLGEAPWQQSKIEMFVNPKSLVGLIPDALRDGYTFWRTGPCIVRGYPLIDQAGTQLVIKMFPSWGTAAPEGSSVATTTSAAGDGNDDNGGSGQRFGVVPGCGDGQQCHAEIHRVLDRVSVEEMKDADGRPPPAASANSNLQPMLLINAAECHPDSDVGRIVEVLTRLDNLSHILLWTEARAPLWHQCPVHLIELTRLGLRFRVGKGRNGSSFSLDSVELSGWFVSERTSDSAARILAKGIRHCIWLENGSGQRKLLVPHHGIARLRVSDSPLCTEYNVYDHADKKNGRAFYVYELHSSEAFLKADSNDSLLYLAYLRAMTREYAELPRLIEQVESDPLLLIHSAWWGVIDGNNRKAGFDVTAAVQAMVVGSKLVMAADSTILGDPAYGSGKVLIVKYAHPDGKVKEEETRERNTLDIGKTGPAAAMTMKIKLLLTGPDSQSDVGPEPDAVACYLRLVCKNPPTRPWPSKIVETEPKIETAYSRYIEHWDLVSAGCRLTMEQEQIIAPMFECAFGEKLINREMIQQRRGLLDAVEAKRDGVGDCTVPVARKGQLLADELRHVQPGLARYSFEREHICQVVRDAHVTLSAQPPSKPPAGDIIIDEELVKGTSMKISWNKADAGEINVFGRSWPNAPLTRYRVHINAFHKSTISMSERPPIGSEAGGIELRLAGADGGGGSGIARVQLGVFGAAMRKYVVDHEFGTLVHEGDYVLSIAGEDVRTWNVADVETNLQSVALPIDLELYSEVLIDEVEEEKEKDDEENDAEDTEDDLGNGPEKHRVQTTNGPEKHRVQTTKGTKCSCKVRGLSPQTWYTFRVEAQNPIGISAKSAPSAPVRTKERKNSGEWEDVGAMAGPALYGMQDVYGYDDIGDDADDDEEEAVLGTKYRPPIEKFSYIRPVRPFNVAGGLEVQRVVEGEAVTLAGNLFKQQMSWAAQAEGEKFDAVKPQEHSCGFVLLYEMIVGKVRVLLDKQAPEDAASAKKRISNQTKTRRNGKKQKKLDDTATLVPKLAFDWEQALAIFDVKMKDDTTYEYDENGEIKVKAAGYGGYRGYGSGGGCVGGKKVKTVNEQWWGATHAEESVNLYPDSDDDEVTEKGKQIDGRNGSVADWREVSDFSLTLAKLRVEAAIVDYTNVGHTAPRPTNALQLALLLVLLQAAEKILQQKKSNGRASKLQALWSQLPPFPYVKILEQMVSKNSKGIEIKELANHGAGAMELDATEGEGYTFTKQLTAVVSGMLELGEPSDELFAPTSAWNNAWTCFRPDSNSRAALSKEVAPSEDSILRDSVDRPSRVAVPTRLWPEAQLRLRDELTSSFELLTEDNTSAAVPVASPSHWLQRDDIKAFKATPLAIREYRGHHVRIVSPTPEWVGGTVLPSGGEHSDELTVISENGAVMKRLDRFNQKVQ